MRKQQPSKQSDYVRALFAPEDAYLQEMRQGLDEQKLGMQMAADEAKILQFLVRLVGAKKIVEIGSLVGYSAIWMARAMESDGHIYAVEHDETHVSLIQANAKACEVDHIIKPCHGSALDVLPSLEAEGPFDIVFIDADKISYGKYLDWAEKHTKKGGLIIGDNSLLFGAVFQDEDNIPEDVSKLSWQVMQEFNARLADTSRYSSILLQTEEGLTIAQKLY